MSTWSGPYQDQWPHVVLEIGPYKAAVWYRPFAIASWELSVTYDGEIVEIASYVLEETVKKHWDEVVARYKQIHEQSMNPRYDFHDLFGDAP